MPYAHFRRAPFAAFWIALSLLFSAALHAAPDVPEAARNELEAAFQAAGAAIVKGPTNVPIGEQATLQLPTGYHFVPGDQARPLLEAMGNPGAENVQGMIFPANEENAQWFIVVTLNLAGYIKDDDAKNWKSEALLDEIRKGTEAANSERRARGLPELLVAGWVEEPQYEPETHRLVWSLSSRLSDQEKPSGVNYNTLMLGREGYISMNLVTSVADIERLKPVARKLLASLEFDPGKRYADFQAETDKIAEYGLAALVAGVAAKKLGLFALAALFVAKFAKVIIAAAVVGLGWLATLIGKKKRNQA